MSKYLSDFFIHVFHSCQIRGTDEELTGRGMVYVTKMKKNSITRCLWTVCVRTAALGLTKHLAKALELFCAGYNRQNCSDVLPEFRKFLNQTDADLKIMLSEASESQPEDTGPYEGLVLYEK